MARGLDHIVHAVRDLDAAAELYRRLGFTVGARNRHPRAWGTQNHIVQLPGTYVELLAVADATHMVPHAERAFSFGAYNRDFLARQEGLSMIALEGRGQDDADAFRDEGIGDFETYELKREGRRPDGTPLPLTFVLAFACDPNARDVGFFSSLNRNPENFWNPAFQMHANGSVAVAGVILVAENPGDHEAFLSAFVGKCDIQETSGGIAVQTARGTIEVMEPAAFGQFGGEAPDVSRGARLAALRFVVEEITPATRLLQQNGVDAERRQNRLVVSPKTAMGATLVFERGVDPGPARTHGPGR